MSKRIGALSWFIPILLVIMLIVILVGFVYLQNEITDLKNSTSATPSPNPTPRPTPVLTVTPTPQATQTTPAPGSTTTITSGNTALTCSGSLSIADVSSGEELLIYAKITNDGNATAYNVNLRIQSYYPDGSKALNYVKTLDAGNYPQILQTQGTRTQ
jgi:hypothetical protein